MTADPGRRNEQRWSNEADAVAGNVSQLRRALVAFATENGADARTQGSIALAASEVITNSVLHAYIGTSPGVVSIKATAADGRLHVTISDDGSGMKPRRDSPGLGLGLPTIAQVAASVSIAPGLDGRGTAVSLEFPLS